MMKALFAGALLATFANPAIAGHNEPPVGIHTAIVRTDARGTWYVDWPKNTFGAKEPPFVQAVAIIPGSRNIVAECQVRTATTERADGTCYIIASEDGRIAAPPFGLGSIEVRVLGAALPIK